MRRKYEAPSPPSVDQTEVEGHRRSKLSAPESGCEVRVPRVWVLNRPLVAWTTVGYFCYTCPLI